MAGDWIKMRTNLDSNPKVIRIASILGKPELHVVGMLWKVWSWADAHTTDGNAICVTSVTLDRFTGVTGFADALRNVGWLEGRDDALSFSRFTEHNGQTAKNRCETAKRVAKHRNAKSVTNVTPKSLPEKRREEKSKTVTNVTVEIPSELDCDEFRKAWCDWCEHRKQIKKPITELAGKKQMNRLVKWGLAKSIASIDFSIRKGWIDIFPAEEPPQPESRLPSDDEIEAKWNPHHPTGGF